MAIFAHAYEMFKGVAPLAELFRYFFALSQMNPASPAVGVPPLLRTVGRCCFRMQPNRQVEFISFAMRDKWV